MDEFRDIIEQYRHKVYTLAYYQLGNHDDAEDATQEAFIRLWKHWGTVKTDTILQWLLRVTRNVCIDMHRKHFRERATIGGERYEVILETVSSDQPNQRTIIEQSEFANIVQEKIRDLEEPYRSILILREIQEMSYAGIGETLDMPINSIKGYLHRGRRLLRELLKESVTKHEK